MLKGKISFENTWPPGAATFNKLLKREPVNKSEWHELFGITSKIASWVEGGCDGLRDIFKIEVSKHVTETAEKVHMNTGDTELLRAYIQAWTGYRFLVECLPYPFACATKSSGTGSRIRTGTGMKVPRTSSSGDNNSADLIFELRNLMYKLWNENIFDKIHGRLLKSAMELLLKERREELVESQLIVGVRESFVNYDHGSDEPLKKYTEHFEKKYIDSCREFYEGRAAEYLKNHGILDYMAYAYANLTAEEERAKRYLDSSQPDSFQRFTRAIVQILVVQFQDQLLAEAKRLIIANETKRLRELYGLVNKTEDGIPPLLDCLSKHIVTEGLDSMRNNAATITSDPEKYVDQLLSMYNKFSALVKEAFCNDARFLTVRDQAFQKVVNNTEIFSLDLATQKASGKSAQQPPESKCPELLANFCDLLLRKSALTKKLTSEDIDEKLNNVLLVLKYITSKDVFMRFYKQHLSRRLILELSADQDKEESVVNKFREQGMPSEFVSKLVQMLRDVEINKEFCAEFKRSISDESEHKAIADAINLKVLNAGAWSRGRDKCHVTFPDQIDSIIPEMEDFYKRKHTGRKLNWAHNWSSASIMFSPNEKRKYELEVSAFQMAVLFCWNDRPLEKVSFEGLRVATELLDDDLKRTIMSLVMNPKVKLQVLLTDCQPINPKDFNESTLFWINTDFAVIKGNAPQPRGRVSLVNRINMNEETVNREAHEEIIRLRQFRVQEAIVKVMKTRRVMNHIPLHNEVVDILKNHFCPTRRLIKEQVEWLIEEKYVERDEDDPDKLIYVT